MTQDAGEAGLLAAVAWLQHLHGVDAVSVTLVADEVKRPRYGVGFALGVAAKAGRCERVVRSGQVLYRVPARRFMDDETTIQDMSDWHTEDRVDCSERRLTFTTTGLGCPACGWACEVNPSGSSKADQ